eukprot:1459699-Ditylum_brightwellii.AAC.1
MIHARALPPNASHVVNSESSSILTIAGTFESKRMVKLTDIALPEFGKTKRIDQLNAYVFDSPCAYDVILGRDFLYRAGLNLNFEKGYIEWMGQRIQMRSTINRLNSLTVEEHLALYNDDTDEEENMSF